MDHPKWSRVVFIDTEKTGNTPWSVQYGDEVEAWIWIVGEGEFPWELKMLCEQGDVLTVLHNALFDIPVLRGLGINPCQYVDTMQMAYLLGMDKIGLKVLAYRLCGMKMRGFDEVTAGATQRKAEEYLRRVVEMDWDDPLPILHTDKGVEKIKWPQNIKKKVKSLLGRWEKCGGKLDLYGKWWVMELEGGRSQVEQKLGKMRRGWLEDVDRDKALDYALTDVRATAAIYPILWEMVRDMDLEDALWRDMAAMEMVMDMEGNGCLLDLEFFHQLSEGIWEDVRDKEDQLARMARGKVNVNSSPQVMALLRREGIEVEGTGSEVLDKHRGNPIVSLIQDIRGLLKLLGTYVDKFPNMVDGEGRIHTKLSMTRTDTGRLASSSPNLQNIPVRTAWGKKVRRGFAVKPGMVMLAIDYSQIEMRLAAHVSGDEFMCGVFRDGGDIHTMTASRVYRKPPEEVDDKKERYPMKRAGFGVLYGITGAGLLNVFYHEGISVYSELDCDRFIAEWYEVFPGIRLWQKQTEAFAMRNGYVADMFGRRRWIPEVYSALPFVREAGLRQAINAPIQSGAQGVIKEAMGRLMPKVREWQEAGFAVNPLLQIHDELLFEVEEGIVPMVAAQFSEVMIEAVQLSVPVKVDVEVGMTWLDMVGVDEWMEERDGV